MSRADGEAAFQRFTAWVEERWDRADWENYIAPNGAKLKRREIAKECLFGIKAFQPAASGGNKRIHELLRKTETRLCADGILLEESRHNGSMNPSSAEAKAEAAADAMCIARLQVLEQENMLLKTQLREAIESLRKYDLLDRHMRETGRLIR